MPQDLGSYFENGVLVIIKNHLEGNHAKKL